MAHNSFNDLFTKQDYLDLAEKLCRPLLTYFNPNESTVHLPHRFRSNNHDDEEAIESFSRPLWGMVGLVKNGDYDALRTTIIPATKMLENIKIDNSKYSKRIGRKNLNSSL